MGLALSPLWTGWPPLALHPSETGPGQPIAPLRRATSPTENLAVDGHSLTNTMEFNGPWPTNFRSIRNSQMDPDSLNYEGQTGDWLVLHSSIPGSPMFVRLGYDATPEGYVYSGAPRSECWRNLDQLDEITMTEGGPVFRLGYPGHEQMKETTLRFFVEACERAIAAGITRINIWSIWPQLDGWQNHPSWAESWGALGGFRAVLIEYGRSFKYLADYLNWKLKRLHPELPADFRVWFFPGHLFMLRLFDGIAAGTVPGFDTFPEIFHPTDPTTGQDRQIHPDPIAGYGFAAFGNILHYQIDLARADATSRPVYIPPAFIEQLPDESAINWRAVPRAYAEWAWATGWDIASRFGPAGLGGTEGMALEFDGAVDADPLAPLPPVEAESPIVTMGAASRALLEGGAWVAGYTPALAALAGTSLPTQEAGYLAFRSSVIGGAHAASGARYGVIAIRILDPGVNINRAILQWVNDLGTSWNAARLAFELNAWTARYALGDGTTATQAAYAVGVWQVVEFWTDADEIGTAVRGGATSIIAREAEIPTTSGLMLGGGTSFGGPDNPADFDLAGLFLCDGIPTSAQRAKLVAWATSQIPT